ncbi:hypothetical protein IEQ34_003131 [Dendrobium chrysotoxum]|uniref:Uncharacterized protein n=1 Tax=Dendrobium chrysotoxum TaxID=161865 RepID=A0AAV7HKG1_DENCH|nr:hypothetical protein IEQ34_003131 [Dendrobium chrysotoxum]
MSNERTFGPWEEMQRHGQDLACRLAHGFSGLLHCPIIPPSFTWPLSHPKTTNPFDTDAILDIGNSLSRAGVDFVACLNGVVQQFFRRLPMPFRLEDGRDGADKQMNEAVLVRRGGEGSKIVAEEIGEWRLLQKSEVNGGMQRFDDEGTDLIVPRQFGRSQGSINLTTTYNSRTNGIDSFLVARGDLWRAEVSHGLSTSGNENPPLFLIQLGPVLFFRDTTLLLPVHISKQHLLWYGYDRKNGLHSVCPALWSKHRRWLFMSMICLNPLTCSFMDLQFPNGQLTYIAGEGLTHSAYLTAFGGLLQAQGQYPGETRFSFSCKNKHGTRITPVLQLPDKSFAVGLAQTLAWRRSGLIVRPSVQLSICPTFGGSNPGLRAELIQTLKEKLNLICGFSFTAHSSAFASLAIGRSKWNGHIGSSGIVFRLEAPLNGVGRPSFAVQLNSGAEF